MSNNTIYQASNVNQYLDPIPVTDVAGLPYNLTSTPLFGNPTGSLPTDFLNYYNGTGTDFLNNGIVQKIAASSGTLALPAGSGPGQRGEATAEFVANQWQTFFYVYQPFVTDQVAKLVTDSVEDPSIKYSNLTYYTGLFEQKFADWMSYRRSTNGVGDDATSFRSYLANQTDMGYRQRNVIFWQFARIIGMLDLLQAKTLRAATRQTIWMTGAKEATDTMAGRVIPQVTGSSEDVRVPDPDSINAQHIVMMDLERDRANQRKSEDKGRTDDAITSFGGDGVSQQKATMQSFWNSLSTVLNNIIN